MKLLSRVVRQSCCFLLLVCSAYAELFLVNTVNFDGTTSTTHIDVDTECLAEIQYDPDISFENALKETGLPTAHGCKALFIDPVNPDSAPSLDMARGVHQVYYNKVNIPVFWGENPSVSQEAIRFTSVNRLLVLDLPVDPEDPSRIKEGWRLYAEEVPASQKILWSDLKISFENGDPTAIKILSEAEEIVLVSEHSVTKLPVIVRHPMFQSCRSAKQMLLWTCSTDSFESVYKWGRLLSQNAGVVVQCPLEKLVYLENLKKFLRGEPDLDFINFSFKDDEGPLQKKITLPPYLWQEARQRITANLPAEEEVLNLEKLPEDAPKLSYFRHMERQYDRFINVHKKIRKKDDIGKFQIARDKFLWGGIVFGNKVDSPKDMLLEQINWVPSPPGESNTNVLQGVLQFEMKKNDNEDVLAYYPARFSEVTVAYNLTQDYQEGHAIGLFSIIHTIGLSSINDYIDKENIRSEIKRLYNERFYFEKRRQKLFPRISEFIWQPSLGLYSSILQSAYDVDIGVGGQYAEYVGEKYRFWTITDSEMTIKFSCDNNNTLWLTVRPDNNNGSYLCFFPLPNSDPPRSLPLKNLEKGSHQYDRAVLEITEIAKICAIFRWARLERAEFHSSGTPSPFVCVSDFETLNEARKALNTASLN